MLFFFCIIAISQAGIAAQTLTLMQGFEGKKKKATRISISTYTFPKWISIFRKMSQMRSSQIEPDREDSKVSALTTTPPQPHSIRVKMSDLKLMYEKKRGC